MLLFICNSAPSSVYTDLLYITYIVDRTNTIYSNDIIIIHSVKENLSNVKMCCC